MMDGRGHWRRKGNGEEKEDKDGGENDGRGRELWMMKKEV